MLRGAIDMLMHVNDAVFRSPLGGLDFSVCTFGCSAEARKRAAGKQEAYGKMDTHGSDDILAD